MLFYDLLNGIDWSGTVENREITDVCSDSRKCKPGCVFVCIKGLNFDGHDHAAAALESGAAAVVCERDLGLPNQAVVENSRLAYSVMCGNYFGNPASRLRMIGVTGTNGKTTVTTLIKNVLSSLGLKVGLIGTIQNEIMDEVIPAHKTTPDAYELHQLFARMEQQGCEFVVMEVSSHALDQCRLGRVAFEISVFTNLTQDHLDYHKDMEDYFAAKKKLFDMTKTAIINIDDSYGQRLALMIPEEVVTCSTQRKNADFYASDIQCLPTGVEFHLTYREITSKIMFGMPGNFSVQNALAAAAVCLWAGISLERVVEGLNACKGVKGRSEVIPTGRDFTVICDYAHSPDGLRNILPSMREHTQGRLIALFGCGGDRDVTKRPIMGEVAAENADFLIVTSDNPRTEDPEKIIQDILPGVRRHSTEYVVIPDRREAIFYAVQNAQPGDVIVLAGKGHENYQVLKDQTIHFDEREVVAQALAGLPENDR